MPHQERRDKGRNQTNKHNKCTKKHKEITHFWHFNYEITLLAVLWHVAVNRFSTSGHGDGRKWTATREIFGGGEVAAVWKIRNTLIGGLTFKTFSSIFHPKFGMIVNLTLHIFMV